jgi:hypothetical protein
MSQEITVDRTGDRPLAFSGREWASASSYDDFEPANTRWHEIALYEVERAAGGYVVSVAYRTNWDTETDHNAAKLCVDAKNAAEYLRDEYDPLKWFIGPPSAGPGSPQEQRRERLMRDLRLRYQNAVSEVLEKLEPERVE